jgi:peptidoglycan/LPS O-acetylase OafA/YrhL
LRAATALVGCQGLVLLAAAGVLVVETLTGRSTDATGARLTAVLALFGGVGLILVARALARRRRWARAPALVTQLLLLPIGVSVVQAGQAPIGVPLLLMAGGLVLLLLSQPVGEALRP